MTRPSSFLTGTFWLSASYVTCTFSLSGIRLPLTSSRSSPGMHVPFSSFSTCTIVQPLPLRFAPGPPRTSGRVWGYLFPHLCRICFGRQPHLCHVPNPAPSIFIVMTVLYLLDIPSPHSRSSPHFGELAFSDFPHLCLVPFGSQPHKCLVTVGTNVVPFP